MGGGEDELKCFCCFTEIQATMQYYCVENLLDDMAEYDVLVGSKSQSPLMAGNHSRGKVVITYSCAVYTCMGLYMSISNMGCRTIHGQHLQACHPSFLEGSHNLAEHGAVWIVEHLEYQKEGQGEQHRPPTGYPMTQGRRERLMEAEA